MATRRGFAFAVLALLGASVATSAEPACHTMLSGIKTLDFLSTFAEAVDKAGLTRAFTGQGAAQKSVVLVPTDGAFEESARKLGIDKSEFMDNPLTLRRLIQNHVIPGDVDDKSVVPKVYSTMDFGSYVSIYSKLRDYGFAVQRDDEMIVETENSTISTKATQIMHTLCDESKLYVVGKVLIPSEINKADVFQAPASTLDIPAPAEDAPPGFFRRMFPGLGGESAAETPPTSGFAMFPGMRRPSPGSGPAGIQFPRMPTMPTMPEAGASMFAAASTDTASADEGSPMGFGPGLMSGLASGADIVPEMPTMPSTTGTGFPAIPAGGFPGMPSTGFPSASGMFGSSSAASGSASFPTIPSFPGFPGFGSSGSPGLGSMVGGASAGALADSMPAAASSVPAAAAQAAPAA